MTAEQERLADEHSQFTVGYSWVDEHVYQTANQGSGAPLAGRRALLVLIGEFPCLGLGREHIILRADAP
jgi:hypothetical protein